VLSEASGIEQVDLLCLGALTCQFEVSLHPLSELSHGVLLIFVGDIGVSALRSAEDAALQQSRIERRESSAMGVWTPRPEGSYREAVSFNSSALRKKNAVNSRSLPGNAGRQAHSAGY
jgi:hypothetical protein